MAIRMGLMTAIGDAPDMEVVADVEDGQEAVDAYRKHRPDIVVLDLRMHGMNGVDAIRALRKEFGAVRVLIYSNYARGEEVYQALRAGASGIVVKEMALETLRWMVLAVVLYAGLVMIRAAFSGRRMERDLTPEAAANSA